MTIFKKLHKWNCMFTATKQHNSTNATTKVMGNDHGFTIRM